MREPSVARRPRPVADAPVAALVAQADSVARDWLLALLAASPLERASAVPVADLAREAPSLCAAMARALASDAELERLGVGGDLAGAAARAGALAGAPDAASAAAAVETLRGVMWSAVRGELVRPEVDQVAELSGRVAHVCAVVVASALAGGSVLTRGAPPSPKADEPSDRLTPTPESPTASAPPPPPAAATLSSPPPAGPATPRGPVIASAPTAPGVPTGPPPPFFEPDAEGRVLVSDARPAVEPATTRARSLVSVADPPVDAWPKSWLGALARRLERYADEHVGFAVLVLEVDGLERLLAAQTGREVATAIDAVERGIGDELRPADALIHERMGRYWLLAPDTDRAAARQLARRLIAAARQAGHRGAPLTLSVGVALCPDDAHDATTLSELADEGLFAARANGGGSMATPPV